MKKSFLSSFLFPIFFSLFFFFPAFFRFWVCVGLRGRVFSHQVFYFPGFLKPPWGQLFFFFRGIFLLSEGIGAKFIFLKFGDPYFSKFQGRGGGQFFPTGICFLTFCFIKKPVLIFSLGFPLFFPREGGETDFSFLGGGGTGFLFPPNLDLVILLGGHYLGGLG